MVSDDDLLWRALADPVRREILDMLRPGPRTTGQIASNFDQTRFGVMKHIGVLEEAGLLTVERRGRERWNYLNGAKLASALSRWLDRYQAGWADQLHALGLMVEGSNMPPNEPNTIDIRHEVEFRAPRERVFDAMTRNIDAWWRVPYRQVENGVLSLAPEAGGRLIETGADGHVAVWATVDEVRPGRLLSMSGRFGMNGALAAHVTFELTETLTGTRVVLRHRAVGMFEERIRSSYVNGWKDLLDGQLGTYLADAAA